MLIRSHLSPLVGEFNFVQWLQSCRRGAQPSAALSQRSGRMSMRIKVHRSKLFFFFFYWPTPCIVAPSRPTANQWEVADGVCLAAWEAKIISPGRERGGGGGAAAPSPVEEREKRESANNKGLIVSLSPGSPVHYPAVSVSPGPGPPRRRPAAAKSESSSSQHPESSHLPFFTASYSI